MAVADDSLVAIEDVYRRRYRSFLRVALAIVGDRDGAHDAVQETFARALRGRHGYRAEGALESWIWATLLNVCRDVVRRRRPASGATADGEPAANGAAESWPELRAAIAALPERQRHVLFLRYYADLDYESIAATLGVERGTVAAALHAAHGAVRTKVEEVAG